jgi:hypothetical protein
MSVLGMCREQSRIRDAIDQLRRRARNYRAAAARAGAKTEANMMLAMSRQCEEEALRLEVGLVLARPIETTGG